MTECKICLFDDSIAKIHDDGICEYCKLQDKLREASNPEEWEGKLEEIKKKGKGKQYDCLIGISGGEDSSVMLYLAVFVWGLRPLVIHFNNHTNRPEADHNIRLLVKELNVNFIEYFIDKGEYDRLCDSFLMAGVQDADLANDVCMAKLMHTTALNYGIKYIFNGHSFREEGSSPKAWSIIDYTYVKSVYEKFWGKMRNYPLYTVWDQIVAGVRGIRQVRPFHYDDFNRQHILRNLKALGWKDYGGKHNENIYTAFIGNFLLPTKFGIDKRRTYLSAQIREGNLTKEVAKLILDTPATFNFEDLGDRKNHILHIVSHSSVGKRSDYKMTDFRGLKPLFWLLMKIGVFPSTAYAKYCK